MKTLALYNIKGGVGKTSSAVNLACIAAGRGFRTLLWDLDPQGAATYTFRIRPRVEGGGRRLIRGRSDLAGLIRGSDFPNLDVLPADFSYREMDEELSQLRDPDERVASLIAPLGQDYDVLLFDCSPGLSRVSESVFAACDVLAVPTIPTTLSLRTLAQLMVHLKDKGGRRPLVLPFFCMVDLRKGLHRSVCAWVDERPLGFLRARIPYSSLVEQMGIQRAPVAGFARGSAATRSYEELWAEIDQRLAARDDRGEALFAAAADRELERTVSHAIRRSPARPSARDARPMA